MILTYLKGFLAGFLMCVSFGTVFFALLQNSVDNGYWSGVKISIGGILSDIMYISIAIFGVSFLPHIEHFDMILRTIGAIFLLVIGVASWRTQSPKLAYPKTKLGDLFYYLGLGFTLNTINPVNFFIWAGLAASVSALSASSQLVFFFGCLSAVFLTQFVIAYYANYFQKYFTTKTITLINRVAGTTFIGTGLYLGWQTITFLIRG